MVRHLTGIVVMMVASSEMSGLDIGRVAVVVQRVHEELTDNWSKAKGVYRKTGDDFNNFKDQAAVQKWEPLRDQLTRELLHRNYSNVIQIG